MLQPFLHETPAVRVLFGPGRFADVPDEITRLDAERALLIGGPFQHRQLAAVGSQLPDRVAAVFDGVEPQVPVAVVDAVVTLAQDRAADLLVSVGGGSAAGTAKAAARQLGLPILAVPTTYSGAELSSMWAVTENGRTVTAEDPAVVPRTVVYDPLLTLDLPVAQSGDSGLHALAHLVEGLYAPEVSPLGVLAAREGIRTLAVGLPKVAAQPLDIEARTTTLYGAWLAGWTLGTTTTGVHHAICRIISDGWATAPAATHAAVLPHATIFNAEAAEPAMRRIKGALADASRPSPRSGVGVWELAGDIGATMSLQSLGIPETALDQIAAAVVEDAPPNPRPLTFSNVRNLVQAAWVGARPTDIPE